MKMLDKKRDRTWKKIKVTGIDGDVMEFGSIKEAAEFLDVTCQALYIQLKKKAKVRGCTVKGVR